MARSSKPLHWVGSSKKDLMALPGDVVDDTARQDVDLIHERLRAAQKDYEVRYAGKED